MCRLSWEHSVPSVGLSLNSADYQCTHKSLKGYYMVVAAGYSGRSGSFNMVLVCVVMYSWWNAKLLENSD